MSTFISIIVRKTNSSWGRSESAVASPRRAPPGEAGTSASVPSPERMSRGMSSALIRRPGARTTMLSTRLRSSRTFPGQR